MDSVFFRKVLLSAFFTSAFSPLFAADYLAEGRDAFLNYDFDLASELFAKYAKSLKAHPDPQGKSSLEKLQRQLEIAENSLNNVRKIEVIDRIDVPADEFVCAVALPKNEGALLPKNSVPLKERYNDSDFVFCVPDGDFMLWTERDDSGVSHIFESSRLIDGSWEAPSSSGDILNGGGSVKNPFMLTDGSTLYFVGNGEDSMGGYDIFVATKDPDTGEYRQPVGVGYPFNSPFNEYLMVIDEDNGVGWWVTDRNQIKGMLSVYVFVNDDVRKNYDRNAEDDIVGLAKVSDVAVTQNPDTDYAELMQEINRRGSSLADINDNGIDLHLPGGRVIRQMSDFKSASAKRSMALYLNANAEYISNVRHLADLRRKFYAAKGNSKPSAALSNQIRDLEKITETQRGKLRKMLNAVISAELDAKNNRRSR